LAARPAPAKFLCPMATGGPRLDTRYEIVVAFPENTSTASWRIRRGAQCWGDSCTVASGWQCNCHPNDGEFTSGRGRSSTAALCSCRRPDSRRTPR
jgi:hypothetical protein